MSDDAPVPETILPTPSLANPCLPLPCESVAFGHEGLCKSDAAALHIRRLSGAAQSGKGRVSRLKNHAAKSMRCRSENSVGNPAEAVG